jgi:hypothetical protein
MPLLMAAAATALVLVLAVVAGQYIAQRREQPGVIASSTPTETAFPSASTVATASPGNTSVPTATVRGSLALRSDLGFLTSGVQSLGTQPFLRRESEDARLWQLHDVFGYVASPDGTRVAYWQSGPSRSAPHSLRIIEVSSGTETTLVTLAPEELGDRLAWSSDGTGIALSVQSAARAAGGVDAPPVYDALRVIDVSGSRAHELTRITTGLLLAPLAWDRSAKVVAAGESGAGGFSVNYDVIAEDGSVSRTPLPQGQFAAMNASFDARLVFASLVNQNRLRVWELQSPMSIADVATENGERLWLARWRPRSHDIAVAVADRIELWSIGGAGRSRKVLLSGVATGGPGSIIFRADGTAFATKMSAHALEPWILVDATSGTSVALPASDEGFELGVVLR